MNRAVLAQPAMSIDRMLALTATEALDEMRQGTLKSVDYVLALLSRANQLSRLNSLTSLNADGALKAAQAVDAARERGEPLGPLAGLPILVKDNIDAAGMVTTGATPALRYLVAARNAPALDRLMQAGAIILAKASLHELAFGSTCTNAAFGYIRNPYDTNRIPGGSSGGTAAALAARIAPAGLGTDTGASVRNPASFCGIVGFRPSVGNGGPDRRYAGEGVVPISRTRDTVGPMARTVADVALLDAVVTGTEVVEPVSLAGLRIGLPHGGFWENIDTEVRSVMDQAVSKLREAGVVFIEADLGGWEALNERVSMPVALYEFYHRDLAAYLRESGSTLTVEQVIAEVMSPDVVGVFGIARNMSEAEYQDAIKIYRPRLMDLYANYFKDHEVEGILFPTVPILPPPIDPAFSGAATINGVEQPGGPAAQFKVLVRNVDPGSNAGLPGLAQPAGMSAGGLPVGLEIDGPLGSDRRLLGIGLSIERVLGLPPAPAL